MNTTSIPLAGSSPQRGTRLLLGAIFAVPFFALSIQLGSVVDWLGSADLSSMRVYSALAVAPILLVSSLAFLVLSQHKHYYVVAAALFLTPFVCVAVIGFHLGPSSLLRLFHDVTLVEALVILHPCFLGAIALVIVRRVTRQYRLHFLAAAVWFALVLVGYTVLVGPAFVEYCRGWSQAKGELADGRVHFIVDAPDNKLALPFFLSRPLERLYGYVEDAQAPGESWTDVVSRYESRETNMASGEDSWLNSAPPKGEVSVILACAYVLPTSEEDEARTVYHFSVPAARRPSINSSFALGFNVAMISHILQTQDHED